MQLESFTPLEGSLVRQALKFGNQKLTFTMQKHRMFFIQKTPIQALPIFVS